MKYKMLQFFMLLTLLAVVSCGADDPLYEESREIDAELKGKVVSIDNFLYIPSKLLLTDDHLIVYDDKEEGIFNVFRLPALNFLFSYGKKGKGPDEFQFIDISTMKSADQGIDFLDYPVFKSFEVDDDKRLVLKDKFNLDFLNVQDINRICKLNDNLYVINHFDPINEPEKEHLLFSREKLSPIALFGKFPKLGKDLQTYEANEQFYLKSPVASAAKERFMTFYYRVNRAKLYDFRGRLIKEMTVTGPAFSGQIEEDHLFFMEPFATDNYVYVLMLNQSAGAIAKDFENYLPEIQVWNWEGKLLRRYQLDTPVTYFAVSEKYSKLYAVDRDGEKKILEFDLPTS